MNEDANAPAADESVDTGVDNINSEEGSVTADEVAQVLNIKAPVAEEKAEDEAEEDAAGSGEDSSDDDTDGEAASNTSSDAKTEVAQSEETEVATAETEAPSFALEVEDADGNKFTLNPGDSLEEVLADFVPKNNGQIFQIVKDAIKMEDKKEKHDADQAANEAQAAYDQKLTDIQAGWDAEAQKLVGEKRLPLVAEGKENERLNEVFKFMMEENQKRVSDGKPPIQTLEDALDKLELKETKAAQVEAAKKAKEENRQRGGMVGGSSAPASSGGPTYSPGMARNATEAAKKLGLL